MTKPLDPTKIMVINKYYPRGLTEGDLYSFYMFNKDKMIKGSLKQNIMLFLSFSPTEPLIVKRKNNNSFMKLTNSNYDKIINGHVVSICKETPDPINFLLFDIDSHDNNIDEEKKKVVVNSLIDKVNSKYMITDTKIYNSSSGYHVYFYFNRKTALKDARKIVSDISKEIIIGRKSINIDISPMHSNGASPIMGALNRNGLLYEEILYDDLHSFKRVDRRIK